MPHPIRGHGKFLSVTEITQARMRTVISVADHWLRMTWFWQPLIVWIMSPILLHLESLLVSCIGNEDGLVVFLYHFLRIASVFPSFLSYFSPSFHSFFLPSFPFPLTFPQKSFLAILLICLPHCFVTLYFLSWFLPPLFSYTRSSLFSCLSHFKWFCLNQSSSLCF